MENWAIFLTVINTGIAAISCFFAWLSAKASRDQIQESQKANVVVNRKMLADMAVRDSEAFDVIFETVSK